MEMTLQELCPNGQFLRGDVCLNTWQAQSSRLLAPETSNPWRFRPCLVQEEQVVGMHSCITREEVIPGPHSPKISGGKTLFLQAEHSHTQKHPWEPHPPSQPHAVNTPQIRGTNGTISCRWAQ